MDDPKRFKQTMRTLALMSTISSYLLGSILVGVFGGRWLDSYFGTNSLFLIIGLFLGLGTGSYGVIVVIKHFLRDQDQR
ncbi:AtpZ/AtpI family protein [Anaerobacillus alkaliphilus]|uniref:AtpZ/AtpI family protein n=1 Tax=Anaerobacillus alkaliphilus TaxID=1548597 RepID=A0A4Q0VVP7_9BACI|nr:AtpZ/AtpI family protein [Anaerobacillus alkaliphilus]RXJ02702.1 AtpZ/AtpI family protein [Anaerobacillus alkaliphilus]